MFVIKPRTAVWVVTIVAAVCVGSGVAAQQLDDYGDPLPPVAVRRSGTVSMRYGIRQRLGVLVDCRNGGHRSSIARRVPGKLEDGLRRVFQPRRTNARYGRTGTLCLSVGRPERPGQPQLPTRRTQPCRSCLHAGRSPPVDRRVRKTESKRADGVGIGFDDCGQRVPRSDRRGSRLMGHRDGQAHPAVRWTSTGRGSRGSVTGWPARGGRWARLRRGRVGFRIGNTVLMENPEPNSGIECLALHPQGKLLACGMHDGTVLLRDVRVQP